MIGWLSDTLRTETRGKLPLAPFQGKAPASSTRPDYGFVPLDREPARRRGTAATDIDALYAAASAAGAAVILDLAAPETDARPVDPAELSLC
ncbi:hypothetical protein [Jiella sp. M17.18]|uniref:hypothetical protein n=1 Tax=Jiella sp. M17.18 TaxID=3234247 RepID=UPI0034DF8B46